MKMCDESKLNETLEFIQNYQKGNGISPSYRTIMKAMNFKTISTVYRYVLKLEAQGKLSKNKLGGIDISPNLNPNKTILAPLVGSVACGKMTTAIENIVGTYKLPADLFGTGPTFILQAKGESMINAGIQNNDFLVIRQCNQADDGDIIVAELDGEATVKRLFRKNGKVILHPENPKFEDIILDDVLIQGKVISNIHKF